jgi:tetratricopeptide (TPR) repeat protein
VPRVRPYVIHVREEISDAVIKRFTRLEIDAERCRQDLDHSNRKADAVLRDDLMVALLRRLRAFAAGDPGQILNDQALQEARTLIESTVPTSDLEAVHLVASLHWARHRALPFTGPQGVDYQTALNLFRLIQSVRPDLVPPELRALLGGQEKQDDSPSGLAAQAADLFVSCIRNSDLEMLGAVIDLFRRASDESDDPLEKAAYLANVCSAMTLRAQWTGSREAIDQAINTGHRAVGMAPAKARSVCFGYLGAALHQRFLLFKDLTDSDAAIEATRNAIATCDLEDTHGPVFAVNLAGMLETRYHRTENDEALEAAIAAFQAVLEMSSIGAMRYRLSASLGDLLHDRWYRHGDPADLNQAIDLVETTLTAGAADPDILSSLGAYYRARFTIYGDIDDLNESIRLIQAAIDAMSRDHPDRPVQLGQLSGAVRTRYAATGNATDLDLAIETGQRAVGEISSDHPARAMLLTDLMVALRLRFQLAGSRDDILAALMHGMTALQGGGAENPIILSNLSITARLQAEVTGDSQVAQTAVFLARQAVTIAAEDHSMRGTFHSNLATALSVWADWGDDVGRIDEAIEAARTAIEVTPDTSADWPGWRSNLAANLMKRFRLTRDLEDMTEAISLYQDCLDAVPEGKPIAVYTLYNLAGAFEARFRHDGHQQSLEHAQRQYLQVAESDLISTYKRLESRESHARLCMDGGQSDKAAASYRVAIEELLPRLVWRGLDRYSQLRQLRHFPGLASDAAAAMIEQDAPEDAVRLLEQGRSVLWAHAMETRVDWTDLRKRHPELAAEFNEICNLLDRNVVHFDDVSEYDQQERATTYSPAELSERQRLAERHLDLLIKIQSLPGFEGFLRIPSFAELRAAADQGPVIIVNVSKHRCDALLLRPGHDDVLVVPLPTLTAAEVAHRARVFVEVITEQAPGAPDPGVLIDARQTFHATTEWLWDEIVNPILDRLFPRQPEASRQLPRVWWCPTGPLSLLPLHAAGHHQDGVAAADRVISSYTPTLRSLIHARARPPADSRSRRVLAIGMSRTPPQKDVELSDLPAVPNELALLRERFADSLHVLQGEKAECDRVKTAIRQHPWVHFACHGTYNLADPSQSRLVLHDGGLSVLEIATERVEGAELAFLSACHTAHSHINDADEAMHVATAFQLAGYQHVIGTLWSVQDPIAPQVARAVYARLGQTPSDAAIALHEAINVLRAGPKPAPLATWASYIHLGP